MFENQPSPPLSWRGAVPIATRFDDPYFSFDDGVAETTHVFLGGNDIPARLHDGFHVAELGFGTGLNLLVTLKAWRDTGQTGQLYFTTFEAYPMAPTDMIRAQAAFPELSDIATELAPYWGQAKFTTNDLVFEMHVGDARHTLPGWANAADAWFLDGFSPAKNPELWDDTLMAEVGRHTKPTGTCATYTAAGFVRCGLESAGFTITRTPGFGRKRHMTRGVKI